MCNILVRKVTVGLIFCFIISSLLASKSSVLASLRKEDALYCEPIPMTSISQSFSYVVPENPIEEMKIIEKATGREETERVLMGLKEPENELEAMAIGRKKIVTISKTTAYCPCKKCCDKDDGITYYGIKAQQYRTIAADKRKYPKGTVAYIAALKDWPNGGWFLVEDIGAAIKNDKIDIFFDSHLAPLDYGIKYLEVEFYLPENT